MATNKRKTTTAIVAGVTAVALLLGGTFAWTSISQQAKNEAAGIVNVGGRLHDDFDGTNKDVYVENFTDPLDGGQPIYARVKLTEYMEVGQDAGGRGDVDGDDKIEAVPVIAGTSIDDEDSWWVHKPIDNCAECNTEEGTLCVLHEHWTWTMGGEGDNGGQTTFIPTFNKDKDSLAADINGTYHGTDNTDKVYYDDYVTYVTADGATVDVNGGTVDGAAVTIPDGATGANALTEANKDVTTVTGTAYYDDDTNTDENDHANGTGVRTETETHTAKQTSTAKVITMEEWLANPVPGNFWVYDEDGWAYWANPIMPGEATGLLLDSIVMEKNPGEKCYYAINVVGQFATVNDWEYFTDSAPSDEAMELLTAASQNVATVTVTNLSGTATVEAGDTVNFSASVSLPNGAAALAAGDFTWSVYNKDLTVNTSSTITENDDGSATLTVGADGSELIIVAKATAEQYLGAVGMSAVVIDREISTTDEMSADTYAILTDDGSGNGTYAMTFIRANKEPTTDNIYHGQTIAQVFSFNETDMRTYPVWSSLDNVTSVSFANPIAPVSMSYWFRGFDSLKSVDFTNLDGSKLTSMYNMFYNAAAIESIDMSEVTVSKDNLIEICDAFLNCTSLKELKVPKYMKAYTSSTSVIRTFNGCTNLTTIIGMETWDVSNVSTFYCMFNKCTALKNIDLSGWKFGSNTDLSSMFLLCESLEQIYGAEDWDVSEVTGMNKTFSSCKVLELDCSNWDVTNVTDYTGFNNDAPGVTPPNWVN